MSQTLIKRVFDVRKISLKFIVYLNSINYVLPITLKTEVINNLLLQA